MATLKEEASPTPGDGLSDPPRTSVWKQAALLLLWLWGAHRSQTSSPALTGEILDPTGNTEIQTGGDAGPWPWTGPFKGPCYYVVSGLRHREEKPKQGPECPREWGDSCENTRGPRQLRPLGQSARQEKAAQAEPRRPPEGRTTESMGRGSPSSYQPEKSPCSLQLQRKSLIRHGTWGWIKTQKGAASAVKTN